MVFDTPFLVLVAPALAALVAALAWWARCSRIRHAARWSADLEVLARRSGRATPVVLGLAAFAAGLGLAGPRWGRRVVRTESPALDLVLVMDISRSMLAEDAIPSRLGRAQREARRLVQDLAGDRLGLVAFAGQSFILSPLTMDGGALQLLIDALDPDMASAGGTALGAALRQGRDLLRGQPEVADRVLVVFTDGEAHDTLTQVLEAARQLARDGIRLVLVAEGGTQPVHIPVRSPEGEFIEYQRTPDGELVATWRRDEVLTQVADAAHGALVPADLADQAGAVRDLVRAYQRAPQSATLVADRPPQAWVPALGAVLLVLLHTLTRRSAALAALALGLGLGSVAPAQAQWGRNPADLAWQRGQVRLAAQRYLADARRAGTDAAADTVWFNLGTAALAAGDTALAAQALERAAGSLDPEVRFRALYNAGLLALRLAEQDGGQREAHLAAARERYREALLLRPDHAGAKWNLELSIRRSRRGGGGGRGGGPGANPPAPGAGGGGGGGMERPGPVAPPVGLSRAEAEQILNSIAAEERQVRLAQVRRRGAVRESGGWKNW